MCPKNKDINLGKSSSRENNQETLDQHKRQLGQPMTCYNKNFLLHRFILISLFLIIFALNFPYC